MTGRISHVLYLCWLTSFHSISCMEQPEPTLFHCTFHSLFTYLNGNNFFLSFHSLGTWENEPVFIYALMRSISDPSSDLPAVAQLVPESRKEARQEVRFTYALTEVPSDSQGKKKKRGAWEQRFCICYLQGYEIPVKWRIWKTGHEMPSQCLLSSGSLLAAKNKEEVSSPTVRPSQWCSFSLALRLRSRA